MVKAKTNAARKPATKKETTIDTAVGTVAPSTAAKAGKKALKRPAAAAAAAAPAPKQPKKKIAKQSSDEEEEVDSADSDTEDEVEEEVPAEEDDSEASDVAENSDAASDDENDDDDLADVKPTADTKGGISVFVGNLPSNIKREKLIKLFAPHAKVNAVRFRRNDGGQLFNVKTSTLPSIIAFVDVPTEAEAQTAIAALNNTDVSGHVLRVNLQRIAKTAETMDEKRTICVGNLAYAVTDELLRETFECCGEIEYVRTLQNPKGCSGIGFVCFAEAASVPMAFELNNGLLLERPVRVSRYAARKKPVEGKPTKRHQTFGAQRRLAVKQGKSGAGGEEAANKNGKFNKYQKKGGAAADGADKKKKKNEFSGAKVSNKKKGGKAGDKKKGGPRGPKLLAKKIAPRETAAAAAASSA